MNEQSLLIVIRSAVREAFRLGTATPVRDREKAQQQATEYAIGLIVPTADAFVEQAREEGYQDGRSSRPVQVAG